MTDADRVAAALAFAVVIGLLLRMTIGACG